MNFFWWGLQWLQAHVWFSRVYLWPCRSSIPSVSTSPKVSASSSSTTCSNKVAWTMGHGDILGHTEWHQAHAIGTKHLCDLPC